MKTWLQLFGITSLLALGACSVERVDICKTTATSCPGLLNAPKGMTLTALTPTTQVITSIPGSVVATFSEAVGTIDASKFVITGTCANLPTVGSVNMNTEKTVVTATLTGGVCLHNQTLTVTVTPASVTNASGAAGEGSAIAQTYTMNSPGPTATLAAPSSVLMKSGDTSTIALTYTGATVTTLTSAGVTKNQTGTSCNVAVTGATAAGATLTVSGCTGDGTISVSVNAGTAADASGNLSSASPASAVITVDSTGPTLTSLTPASATLIAPPSTVVATFSEEMTDLVASNFVITGTCSPRPSVSGVVMSSGGTVATATLTGGTCTNGQTTIVTVTPSSVRDAIGNAGTGSAESRTYTVSTLGPTATLAAPSVTKMNSSGSSTIALTYTGAVATTLTDAGVTKNQTGVSCTVAVTGASASGATLTVSNCSGTGTITVSVNAGTATNGLGIGSTASAASSAITIDNTGPTLSSLAPNSASVVNMPTEVVATFSEAMTALAASNFVVSGSCSSLPTVTGIAMSAGNTVATATLSSSTCAANATLTVTVDPTTTQDSSGNAGTGSATAVTYTKIDGMAQLTIDGSDTITAPCMDGSETYAIENVGTLPATVTNIRVIPTISGVTTHHNCTGAIAPGNTCGIDVNTKEFSNGNTTLTINYTDGYTPQVVTKDLVLDGYGCRR